MGDSSSAGLDFEGALGDLRRCTESMRLAPSHLLADIVLYSLCIDVLEHAETVMQVSQTKCARAASANVRAALESAVDAAYLTKIASEYDVRAARARVAELFVVAEIERRSPRLEGQADQQSPEEVVIAGARWLDQQVPGSGKPLRGAWERFAKAPGAVRVHWSGLTKTDLYNQVCQADGETESVGAMAGSLHEILSTSFRPRPRVGARELRHAADGTLRIYTRHEEPNFVRNIAALSCLMASSSSARRVRFDAPAVYRARRRTRSLRSCTRLRCVL